MGEFLREHGKAVCKPLHGMGGRSIFVLDEGDKNRNVVFETLTDYGSRYAIVQRYLPEIVTAGDCRVILVDGEPVPFALQRIPDSGDNRGNLAAGARAESRPLNERDRWLCAQIGPKLRAAGMLFVGLDVIGDYVTEINVTSPTGIRELNKKHGVDIGGMLMDAIAETSWRRMSSDVLHSRTAAGERPHADDAVPGGAASRHRDPGRHLQLARRRRRQRRRRGLEVVLVERPGARAPRNPKAQLSGAAQPAGLAATRCGPSAR